MLEGSAAEMLAPPSGMKIQRSGGALKVVDTGRAFERQSHHPPGKLNEEPNFSRLPPHLMTGEDPRGGGDQPSTAELEAIQQIMNQVAQQKKPAEAKSDKSQFPLIQKKVEDKLPVEEKKETSEFKEKIKVVWERVKGVAKKVIYYASGSFIWDKIF